jgi:hypothetical protein
MIWLFALVLIGGGWLVERGRRRVGPLQMLIIWLVYVRAACLMLVHIFRTAWACRERWPEMVEKARREV